MKNKLSRWIKRQRSLRQKMIWLFAFVYLVQMTAFHLMVYKFTDSYIMGAERAYLTGAMDNLIGRLAEHDKTISLSNLSTILYESANSDYLVEDEDGFHFLRTERDVTNMLYINQEVYIFDAKDKLLFTSDEAKDLPDRSQPDEIVTVAFNNREGYLLAEPIRSPSSGEVLGYVQIFHDLSLYKQLTWQVMVFLFLFEIVGVALAAVMVSYATKRFLNPLQQLHDVMVSIAYNPSQLSERSEVRSGDEIEDLSRIFDGMLDKMEAYNSLQSRFISDVSHELRTPIAVVEGHLNLLRRWGKDDPVILEESLEASHEETKRMGKMVKDMLDMVRLQSSLDQFKGETCDLVAVASKVASNFSLIYPDFELTCSKETATCQVAFYQPHLEQAVTIILDNAVKYSDTSKRIDVDLSVIADKAVLSVTDYGQGIAADDLDHIFKRFYRTDQSRSKLSTQGGLGIGLSILNQLVDAYACGIDVESQLGEGTTVTLYVPLATKP